MKDADMTEELDRLEELAKAATQGEWKACGTIYEHMNCEIRSGVRGEGQGIAQVWDAPNAFRDGQFIAAANPAAILRMTALIRQLKAEKERMRGDRTNLDRVREFHETFGVPVLSQARIPAGRVQLRLDLLDEERRELDKALTAGDVVEVADALTDMAYLIYGTALEFGIDLNACFAEVHRSNMSKLGADGRPIYREDGKVLKGPNYFPPDLRFILAAQSLNQNERWEDQ